MQAEPVSGASLVALQHATACKQYPLNAALLPVVAQQSGLIGILLRCFAVHILTPAVRQLAFVVHTLSAELAS